MQLSSEKHQQVPWLDLRWFGRWFETDMELKDDEWERPEPESNVLAVRYAPPKVLWTEQPPVTPGLYFCKLLDGPCRVVEVYTDDRGRLHASWSDIDEFAVSRPGMLWSDHQLMEPA